MRDTRSFLNKIFRNYNDELSLLNGVQYRIVSLPTKDNPFLKFQLVGKKFVLKERPHKIMSSDFLMGFSKADIAIITHLGTKKELEREQAETKPKLLARIAHQLFGQGGKSKFMLKFPEQEQLVEAVPEEVMTNKKALEMLESHDAAMIGYAAAENRFMEMRKEIQELPTCRIICHDFLSELVTYVDEEREATHTMPLTDIFYNKKLLKLFAKLDQQMMSFAAGEAHQKSIMPQPSPVALQLPSEKTATLRLVSYGNTVAEYKDDKGVVSKLPFSQLAFEPDLLDRARPKSHKSSHQAKIRRSAF